MAISELDFVRLAGEGHEPSTLSRPPRVEDELDRPERVSHLKALTQTIEGEIIPRLLVMFSGSASISDSADSGTRPIDARLIATADVMTFGELLMTSQSRDCIDYVELLQSHGVPLETIFLDLMAPAARWLGTLWTEDLRSFTEVTIALGTLQRVFRHFASEFTGNYPVGPARRAFLVPAPGEQHTFGLFVVETFLHRAGWLVDTMPAYDEQAVRAYLAANTVQLVGVSLSCERFIKETSFALQMMREESADNGVALMAGGKVFQSDPKLARELGADATATDAEKTVKEADRLVPWPLGDAARRRIN